MDDSLAICNCLTISTESLHVTRRVKKRSAAKRRTCVHAIVMAQQDLGELRLVLESLFDHITVCHLSRISQLESFGPRLHFLPRAVFRCAKISCCFPSEIAPPPSFLLLEAPTRRHSAELRGTALRPLGQRQHIQYTKWGWLAACCAAQSVKMWEGLKLW